MSLIDVALREKLLAATTVSNIVGTRVYYDALPQPPTLPAVTVRKISDIPDKTAPGLRRARVECSCWSNPTPANGAKSPAEVEGLASAVGAVVHRARLEMQPTSWTTAGGTSYSVIESQVANAPRLIEAVTGYRHVPVDVLVQFRE